MARPATSPASRLTKLKAALPRAAKIGPGESLNQELMCKILGVSRVTLRDWCNEIDEFEESGAFRRGGNGVGYQFNPVGTVFFLISHFEGIIEQRNAEARRQREIAGGGALDAVPEDFDIDQTRKLVQLSNDVQAQKERQQQLVEAAPMAASIRRVMVEIQAAILSTPQEMDPTGSMPVEQREQLDDAARRSALRAQQAGRAVLSELRADHPDPGEIAA